VVVVVVVAVGGGVRDKSDNPHATRGLPCSANGSWTCGPPFEAGRSSRIFAKKRSSDYISSYAGASHVPLAR